jgi:ribonuclease P protein component
VASGFPKTVRLRKRSEYVDVQQRGRKVHSDHFLLLWLRRPDRAGTRVGITVSSKVGNAVVRNRLKRWIREYVRQHASELPGGDVAVVAKTGASACDHDVVDQDLHRLLVRARERS